MMQYKRPSPCMTCRRVPDPRQCENKLCKPWRAWFLERWELIRAYPRVCMEVYAPEPVGVVIGGRHYAAPHQVSGYLGKDPCDGCRCPRELCATPCREKRAWTQAREDVLR